MYKRIMFAGPSGIGKTTLAKWIESEYGLQFISGSVSDLLPETQKLSHSEMLSRDSETLFQEDFQIMNLRNKLFKEKSEFVSDRSYLDVAAYCLYKQADKMPSCELEHFMEIAKMLLTTQCELLIFVDFLPDLLTKWVTEDNNKRIKSNYFQVEIAAVMKATLGIFGYVEDITSETEINVSPFKLLPNYKTFQYGFSVGHIDSVYGKTRVIILHEMNLENRKIIIDKHIYNKK